VELEAELHDHPDRPERSDVQLVQVVAGHVLDHATPGLADDTIGVDDAGADHQIAGGAVQQAERPAGVCCDQPANGGSVGGGRVQGQHLSLGTEPLLEGRQAHAGLDGHGQVGRLVLHDLAEALGLEHQAAGARREPERHPGATAPGNHAGTSLAGGPDRP
jgi:hypothetical protein